MPRNKKSSVSRLDQKMTIECEAQDSETTDLKHEKIIDAALRLFIEQGYHPTTTRQIAKACGMSSGHLYHYISCKDDILYLVHRRNVKMWTKLTEKAQSIKANDPVERFAEILRITLKHMLENRKMYQFVYTESKYLNKKYLHAILEMAEQHVVGFWRKLLKDLVDDEASDEDLHIKANMITHMIWFLPLRYWSLKKIDEKKLYNSILDFVTRGIGLKDRRTSSSRRRS